MRSTTCQRVWEAEAIEDGRLDDLGAASFARHITQCRECAREAKDLREMREAFGRLEPHRLSILEQRRQRAELLRHANQRIVTQREISRRLIVMMAALAALVAVTLGVIGVQRRHGLPAEKSMSPVFELRAFGGASFHDQTSGPNGRVVLSNGSLAVHVEHLRAGQSFVLRVPDGDLGVRGTRFIVEVFGGRTERVLVTEGIVAVHLSGSPERTLAAGESWVRPHTPPAADSELLVDVASGSATGHDARNADDGATAPLLARSTVTHAEQRGAAALGRLSTSIPRDHGSRYDKSPSAGRDDAVATAAPASGEQPATSVRATAPIEFAAAMTALKAGAYLDADDRLSAFAARFPSDARNEDAAFLRAVIAVKRGDSTAAITRAGDYLRRFPRGLRRAEMERLLRSPE